MSEPIKPQEELVGVTRATLAQARANWAVVHHEIPHVLSKLEVGLIKPKEAVKEIEAIVEAAP